MNGANEQLQQDILNWFDQHGRHDLPWQVNANAYRVWISEIMLQQTQVQTVIPYYQRFMQRFPNVDALAVAPLDAVLALWTGLGYYARARNLHRAAQQVVAHHQGTFPADIETLCTLPGVGRSTAGAIVSLAYDLPAPILDGNVKRVLARLFAVGGWPGSTQTQKQLWALSSTLSPSIRCRAFTQAMMDLGATVCTPKQPRCDICPVQPHCLAWQHNQVERYPERRIKPAKPQRSVVWMVLQNTQGQLALEKRPAKGIWGGLFGFPEFNQLDELQAWLKHAGFVAHEWQAYAPIRHTFTHFHLTIEPIKISHADLAYALPNLHWLHATEALSRGLAAPTRQLLETFEHTTTQGVLNV